MLWSEVGHVSKGRSEAFSVISDALGLQKKRQLRFSSLFDAVVASEWFMYDSDGLWGAEGKAAPQRRN